MFFTVLYHLFTKHNTLTHTHTHTRALDDGIIRFLALFCLRKIVHPSLLFFFCVCHSSTFSSLDTSNDNSKSSLRTPTYLYSFFSGRATRCFFLSLSLLQSTKRRITPDLREKDHLTSPPSLLFSWWSRKVHFLYFSILACLLT